MNTVGIYLELRDGQIKPSNFELLTLARQAGREGLGVMFGGDAGAAAKALGAYGLKQLIQVTGEPVSQYNPEIYAEHLARVIRENSLADFIATDSAQGKDLLPRVAAQLEAPLVTDCIAIDFDGKVATKPVYSSKVDARIQLSGEPRLYSLRPNSVVAEKGGGGAPEVTTVAAAGRSTLAEIKEVVQSVAKKIDLTEAQIIVAGGRGVGSAEKFKVLEELAAVLGAAVGASRAAVDAEYVPYEMQVGQTGKVVNPALYIACGISGAVQHFAGMKSSKIIVAINKDAEAPIFKKAHYGIVGDLFEIVPLLTQEFKQVLGG